MKWVVGLVVALSAAAWAQPLTDTANLLNPKPARLLREQLTAARKANGQGWQIHLVTSTWTGQSKSEFAQACHTLYALHKLGDHDALVVIAPKQRKTRIEVGPAWGSDSHEWCSRVTEGVLLPSLRDCNPARALHDTVARLSARQLEMAAPPKPLEATPALKTASPAPPPRSEPLTLSGLWSGLQELPGVLWQMLKPANNLPVALFCYSWLFGWPVWIFAILEIRSWFKGKPNPLGGASSEGSSWNVSSSSGSDEGDAESTPSPSPPDSGATGEW